MAKKFGKFILLATAVTTAAAAAYYFLQKKDSDVAAQDDEDVTEADESSEDETNSACRNYVPLNQENSETKDDTVPEETLESVEEFFDEEIENETN